MLKPLKDLLTYLQRNASSSNIFGLTTTATTMGPNENPRLEETMIASNEDLSLEDTDPLNDPLALDDCTAAADAANVSGTSVGGSEDDEGLSSGKIILVDVKTLKPRETREDELETDDEDEELLEKNSVSLATDDGEEVTEHLPNGDSSREVLENEAAASIPGDIVAVVFDANEIIQIDSDLSIASTALDDTIPPAAAVFTTLADEAAEGEEEEVVIRKTIILNGHYAEQHDGVETVVLPSEEPDAGVATTEQMQGANGEEEEEASDGSDSGLGLEPSRSVAGSSSSGSSSSSPLQRPPIKSSLKRRSEPIGAREDAGAIAQQEKEDGVSSQKRPKKGITFDGVTVYYFPRIQGFGCVPSQGGCTLGMEYQHVHTRRLTLSEHLAEQRKVHRQQLQELNPRSSSSDDDSSSEEEPIDSCSEAESESYGFLQPVSTRQRRALLKAAGVRKIDPTEKDDCREIRTSREVCGCTCRGFCHPDRCACSLAGIKCQVDRANFPCGCTHEGCANTAGRVEFNPGRVRTHYMHTIMRLSMEDSASGGTSKQPFGSGSSVTDGARPGTSGANVISSDKAWSNSSVRLPTEMYPDPASTAPPVDRSVADELDGMLDPVKGLLYHFHSQPHHLPPHHQPVGQQQDGLSHLAHQGVPYHHHAHNHQNYQPTSGPHLLGSATATESLDLQYAFRDYYPAGETGGGVGSGDGSTVPPYYRGDYASYEGGVAAATPPTPLDHYRELPLHVPPDPASVAANRQHMLTTGHDRHPEPGSFVSNACPVGQQIVHQATGLPSIVVPPTPQVPLAEHTAAVPLVDEQPSFSATTGAINIEVVELVEEDCDPNVTVISDSSIITVDLDSSGAEEAIVECDRSDFIALTAPQAGNTERLEAINDLLKSSRRSVAIVRPSIVAEEDDELRDFQHPPGELPPTASSRTVAEEDSNDDDDCVEVVTFVHHTVSRNELRNGDVADGTLRNGHDKEGVVLPDQQNKRTRYSTIEENATGDGCSLRTTILTNRSESVISLNNSSSSREQLPDVNSESSSRDATALEPSENLCEIIKNSIVETTVTH